MLLGKITQIDETTIQAELGGFPAQYSANFDIAVDTLDSFINYQKFLSIGYNDGSDQAECVAIENGVASIPVNCYKHSGRIIISLTFIYGKTIINTMPVFYTIKQAPFINNAQVPTRDTFYSLIRNIVADYVDSYAVDLKNLSEHVKSAKSYSESAELSNTQAQAALGKIANIFPTGGKVGQILTKTETGQTWKDLPSSIGEVDTIKQKVTTLEKKTAIFTLNTMLMSGNWSAKKTYTVSCPYIKENSILYISSVPFSGNIPDVAYISYLDKLKSASIIAYKQEQGKLYLLATGDKPSSDLSIQLIIEGE